MRYLYTAGLVAFFVVGGCGSGEGSSPPQAEQAFVNVDPSVKYVGPQVCADCHREKHETYSHSEMGRSFKKASLSKSAANFERARAVYDPHTNFYYQPFHRGQDLFIREFRLDNDGDTTFARVEKIDYIVGSGQHTNSHIMNINGYLFQMPLTWYVQEGKWDLPPGFEGGANSRFDRPIEVECMSCHNATPGYVPESGNRYDDVPEGIDCERCHGPGEAHVEAIRSGRIVNVDKEIDYTIVNPAKLDTDLQFDVCQRCHLQGTAYTVDGRSFLDFRPGMRLSDVLKVFQPRYADSLEQFIMASHPDRLRMSDCFIQSRDNAVSSGSMTCITCHNPHISIGATEVESYQEACATCHAQRGVGECTESMEARLRIGDKCASCHMPVSESKDIPHVRITDHFIRVPERLTDDEIDRQKEFVQLASLSDARPAVDVMARGYLAHFEQFEHDRQFLDSAAVLLQRALEEIPEQDLVLPLVRLWFLQGEYGRVTALAERTDAASITDPWTLYRIGESYGKLGNARRQIVFLERAVGVAPDHLQFRTKLATAYTSDGQYQRALEAFDQIVEDHPKWADAYNNRGFTYLLLGDFERAEIDFETTLEISPDFEQALGNLASLYANTSRPEKARTYVERLIQIDPENVEYRRLYNRL